MRIIISNKSSYDRDFIYNYLPKYMLNLFDESFDRNRLNLIDKEFNIDSLNVIKFSLKNLKISEQLNSYIIEIDKNKKINHLNVSSLINAITYGDRSCKGYLIVYDIFKLISDNINQLYEEWLDGN